MRPILKHCLINGALVVAKMAEVHGNRTHQPHASIRSIGFEDRAGHQPKSHFRRKRRWGEYTNKILESFNYGNKQRQKIWTQIPK